MDATPSIPPDEEPKWQGKGSEKSFQQPARTRVAETLVPDTVIGSMEQKWPPGSSVSVVPETVEERDDERQGSKSESEYAMDVDEFLWGN